MSADGILQYNHHLCSKLVCILLDQLNYGGVSTFKATLDCLGKIMIDHYPARVSISHILNLKFLLFQCGKYFLFIYSCFQVLEVFLSYAYRLVNLLMDKSNSLWIEISEDSYTEIGIALTECLSRLSSSYGLNNVTNHQYLRLISFILLHQKFHQPRIRYSTYSNAHCNINFKLIFSFTYQSFTKYAERTSEIYMSGNNISL